MCIRDSVGTGVSVGTADGVKVGRIGRVGVGSGSGVLAGPQAARPKARTIVSAMAGQKGCCFDIFIPPERRDSALPKIRRPATSAERRAYCSIRA